MKKNLFVFAAAFAAILSSCAKQELVNPAEDQTEFIVFIEEDAKTALGNKNGSTYPLTWSAGDKICVNGVLSDELSSGSGTKNASFKVSGLGTATSYNVTYPGKLGSDNVAAFPTSVNTSAPVLPMYAAANSRSFTMNHLAAVLKLSFTSATSLKINSIELATPGGEALGGEMTIGKTGTALNGSLSGGQSTLSVDCGSGISLSSTATSVMIPVPAGTYSKGIKITLTDSNMGSMVIVVLNNGGAAAAGKVLEFNTVAYVSDVSSEDLYLIYDTATLQSFVSSVNGGSLDAQSKGAKVTADFTVDASAAESLASVTEYYGVFEGNNKTITGLKKPLFNTLYGQIKNLTLNSTVSISNDETYGTGMFARLITTSSLVDEPGALYSCTAKGSLTWEPADNNDHAVGGLAGRVEGGIISSCTNEATVSVTGSTDGQVMLGGVMGRGLKDGFYSQGSDVSNCENKGMVNFNGSAKNAYIGGVVGYDVEGVCSTSSSLNTGTVQVGVDGYANTINLGGVVGLSAGALDDLSNSGTVQTLWAGGTGPHCYIGGVAGRVSTTSKTLTNLKHLDGGQVIVGGKGYAMEIGGVIGWARACKAQGWQCAGDVTLDGGAYTIFVGGLVGLVGNRKAAKTEQGDGSKHLTFTDCTVESSADITTTADAYIINSTTANDNCLAVGGMFGRIDEGITVGGTSSSAAKVTIVPVSMTSGSAHPYCIGGIAGLITVLGNAATTKGVEFNGVQHTGIVTVSDGANAIYSNLNVGGIVGRINNAFKAEAPVVFTDCVNKGSVTNNASTSSDKNLYVAGVAGKVETTASMSATSFIRCINGDSGNSALGIVTNNGDAGGGDLVVGGISGMSGGVDGLPVTYKGCINYGSVTNSGVATWLPSKSDYTATTWGAATGGIAGTTDGVNKLCATSASDPDRNINYGTITDSSNSNVPVVGGISAYANSGDTDFSYCENYGTVQLNGADFTFGSASGILGNIKAAVTVDHTSNYGDVKVTNSTGTRWSVAGVLALVNKDAPTSFAISYASNEGQISVSDIVLKTNGRMQVGGVLGHIANDNTFSNAFDHLTNSGVVIISGIDNSVNSTQVTTIGGVSGAYADNKLFTNCSNSGTVECGNNNGDGSYRVDLKARCGGVAAYVTMCPQNCSNEGEVNCVKKYNNSNNNVGYVGGIAGEFADVSGSAGTTITGLSSTAAVRSAGASPVAYIGGLFGIVPATITTVTDCTVGGYINGGGTTHGGFFFSSTNSGVTFTNCHLKKGAQITHKVGGTSTTKSYNTSGATLTNNDHFIAEHNGSYTVTNCTVID